MASEDVVDDGFHVVVHADDPLQGPVVRLADLGDRSPTAPPSPPVRAGFGSAVRDLDL